MPVPLWRRLRGRDCDAVYRTVRTVENANAGSQGRCTGLKFVRACTSVFLAGKFLFIPSDTFCCGMYRSATKGTQVEFARHVGHIMFLFFLFFKYR